MYVKIDDKKFCSQEYNSKCDWIQFVRMNVIV